MWFYESTLYQIYPIGFCGAPRENEEREGREVASRIREVMEWREHLVDLGVDAVLFNPIFESDRHGYDARDLRKLDVRLGTNKDFAEVCAHFKEKGIKVILDGVFNHVGRGFWAFQDVLKNRESSAYKDWFHIDFGGSNGYGDGLYYEGWEGHYELVKLNLRNQKVVDHLLECVKSWVEEFGIDGLRLDVAYCLDRDFIRQLRRFCDGLKPEFALVGEMIHGDYRQIVGEGMLHGCTNYECYKGIHSSINENNLFEISYSLNRQFGAEDWTLYRGMHLMNFVDNHDVSRIASVIKDEKQLPLAYGLLFTMPGVPCLYYGSEWGAKGEKKDGDDGLRPHFDKPMENDLTQWVAKLAKARKDSKALCYGSYRNLSVTNKQLAFEREYEGERAVVCLNLEGNPYSMHLNLAGNAVEALTGKEADLSKELTVPPHGLLILLPPKSPNTPRTC